MIYNLLHAELLLLTASSEDISACNSILIRSLEMLTDLSLILLLRKGPLITTLTYFDSSKQKPFVSLSKI